MNWQVKTFAQLTTNELYDILKLRVDVFVVEQTCYYPELDDLDRHPQTIHLFTYQNQQLAAYLRILPANTSYHDTVSIGRVVIAEHARGQGLAHPLIDKAIKLAIQQWPELTIKISAQAYLERFYQQHQFKTVSEVYLEDGIEHIAMLYQH